MTCRACDAERLVCDLCGLCEDCHDHTMLVRASDLAAERAKKETTR